MTQYRPYNAYKPRLPEPAKGAGKRLSFKQALWLGVALFIVIAGVRIDLAQRAHAKAAEQAVTARRVAAVARLNQELQHLADANPLISLSVATSDTQRGQTAQLNAATPVNAASTAKVLSAALYLNQVEKGQKSISQPIGDYRAIQALKQMVQQSDDTVWRQVNDLLGHSALQSYASSLGLDSYDAGSNTISAADMTRLLELLYKGDLLNGAHTSLLLSFMQQTNREDFISPAVSTGFTFYHKVGLDSDQVNDAGIITGGTDALVITVFTDGNGTYDWPQRAVLIQRIAKLAEQAYLN
jgi:beta-lactamase class A